MDLPIQPRSTRDIPKIRRQLVLVKIKLEPIHLSGMYRIPSDTYKITEEWRNRFVCYDEHVSAVGKTMEGAYKNWVSLCIERLKGINSLV